MFLGIEPAAPTGAETTTLHVAIEISRKIWVGGINRTSRPSVLISRVSRGSRRYCQPAW